jgi:ATP-dependent Lon protease
MTGSLGDVMKESATIALEFLKSHAEELGIDYSIFETSHIHIHVPEGATPKDGPSAGITLLTSLYSLLTQQKVREGIAMTGEITLRGKLTPVGGVKEKILAAKRSKIHEIVLSNDNRKDIEDISANYIEGMIFHYYDSMLDALKFTVLNETVPNPKKLKA